MENLHSDKYMGTKYEKALVNIDMHSIEDPGQNDMKYYAYSYERQWDGSTCKCCRKIWRFTVDCVEMENPEEPCDSSQF